MQRLRKQSAFTLIELILVMAIIATVMALAAPSLSSWSKGTKLRNSADEFIAATRWARSRAAADATVYAIAIDKQSNTYHVQMQSGQTFGDVDGQFKSPVTLPEGARIEATGDGRTAIETIGFYPTGRADPASVKITADNGESITIQCATPASDFAVVQEPTR